MDTLDIHKIVTDGLRESDPRFYWATRWESKDSDSDGEIEIVDLDTGDRFLVAIRHVRETSPATLEKFRATVSRQ